MPPANASESQKQLIQLAAKLGLDILATGGVFTNEQVTDSSVLTLFTRVGTQYTYSIGGNVPGGGFGTEFEVFQSLTQSDRSQTSLLSKLDATTASKPIGTYRIGFFCDITNSSGGNTCKVEFSVDGVTINPHNNGANRYDIDAKNDNDWQTLNSVQYKTLAVASTISMSIQFANGDGNDARISNAIIEIWRVS